MLGWTFRSVPLSDELWQPSRDEEIVKGRPAPVILDAWEDKDARQQLRLSMRAGHFGREGGAVTCDRATLEVQPSATEAGGYFTLENMSQRGLAVELRHTAPDLAIAPTLRISYEGTQYDIGGLDPSKLEILREITLGIYERIPSRVDVDAKCVFAETTLPGRYVVG